MSLITEALGLIDNYFPLKNSPSGSNRNPVDSIIKRVGLAFIKSSSRGSGRQNFEPPDFDLNDIIAAYDTDSYIKQAIDKYTDLVFKAGWELVSSNEEARKYIKTRLALIAEATQTPTEEFFNQISEDLIKLGNVFIVKARMPEWYKFPSGVQVKPIRDNKPIVGYFVLPPETIKIARDKFGTVTGYEQEIRGNDKAIRFKPSDVIHITWKKRRGFAFGTPYVLPVLPDIRLLREIEDNVNRLLHKYLHPLYKFRVGLDKEGYESTPEEVEYVKEEINNMQTDGTLVLPERYDVEVVGAQGEAINAEWALKYFEQRAFTGLGVPETVFGRGSSSNRATADNLTSEMHDRVKAFQRVIASAIDSHIINELLLEGGYDPIMNEEDNVDFKFIEIAIDEQIKLENQAMYLYEHNGITFKEFRNRIGYEPEVEDEKDMYLHRVQLVQASSKETSSDDPGSKDTNNKMKPENQYGKKTSPKRTSSSYNSEESYSEKTGYVSYIKSLSNILEASYEKLREDTLSIIKLLNTNKGLEAQIPMVFSLTRDAMIKSSVSYLESVIREGIARAKIDAGVSRDPEIDHGSISLLIKDMAKDIDRLMSDLSSYVSEDLSSKDPTEKVSSRFDVMKHRIYSITRTRLMLAHNYSYALAAKSLGAIEVFASPPKNACKVCKEMSRNSISLKGDFYKKIPPWHTNCWCEVKIKKNGGDAK